MISASTLPTADRSGSLGAEIARLARTASLEMNIQDVKYLADVRARLGGGIRIFVSHLPRQSFDETVAACNAVAAQGLEPVPHLPVRLVESQRQLDGILRALSASGARELLLIAGDYPSAVGPFNDVGQVIATGLLTQHGFARVSMAGHPEGHPKVAMETIRRAERDKARLAAQQGLEVSLVTQFLFEAEPFIRWARELRAEGIRVSLACGLAGPAKISTLLRYAMRCGVGASVRALGTHTASILNVLGDHGPDGVLGDLAESQQSGRCNLQSVHLFTFGGLLRTVDWLAKTAGGSVLTATR